jgi:hypothetical protein
MLTREAPTLGSPVPIYSKEPQIYMCTWCTDAGRPLFLVSMPAAKLDACPQLLRAPDLRISWLPVPHCHKIDLPNTGLTQSQYQL